MHALIRMVGSSGSIIVMAPKKKPLKKKRKTLKRLTKYKYIIA